MGSSRTSTVARDWIEYGLQLVFDDEGGARMTRVPGKMKPNERALELTVKLPTAIFKRPSLVARIEVPPNDISVPPIDITAMQSAIRDGFGADVVLTIQQQEQPS